ncbi:hypothetical protein [Shewanella aestuarii]|uniref:Uncharacterized protein n=1 Tax=Shewanella aestuarii TaxID=1028752 RepID=A0A6G9QRA4_9GAMM|nr:hypothetical protein [Shewanella aestuarii]QIR16585.1 hypothetical protein HBH39_19105 [Shewanella aestuarii]
MEKTVIEEHKVSVVAISSPQDLKFINAQNLDIYISTIELPRIKLTFDLASGDLSLAMTSIKSPEVIPLRTQLASDETELKAVALAKQLDNAAKAYLKGFRIEFMNLDDSIEHCDAIYKAIPFFHAIETFICDGSDAAFEDFKAFRTENCPDLNLAKHVSLILNQSQIAEQIGAKALHSRLTQLNTLDDGDPYFIEQILADCYNTHRMSDRYIAELLNIETVDFNKIRKCDLDLSYHYSNDPSKYQELASCLALSESLNTQIASDIITSSSICAKPDVELNLKPLNSI